MPDVVLPVLDERDALRWVLGRMPQGFHPVVVDNGSTDGSGELARALGAQVVAEPVRGFGAACFAGLQAATSEIVSFMDCDGSLDPQELPHLVESVANDRADLVLGERRPEPGAWAWHARFANRAVVHQVRRLTGLRLKDIGPMRACSRLGLLGLGMADRRSGWPLEMVLRAAAAGWRVREVPVAYRARSGQSKVTGTLLGSARAVRDMGRLLR